MDKGLSVVRLLSRPVQAIGRQGPTSRRVGAGVRIAMSPSRETAPKVSRVLSLRTARTGSDPVLSQVGLKTFSVGVVPDPNYLDACGDFVMFGNGVLAMFDMSGHCEKAMAGLKTLLGYIPTMRPRDGQDLLRQCADKMPEGSHATAMIIQYDAVRQELTLDTAGDGDIQCVVLSPKGKIAYIHGPDVETMDDRELQKYMATQHLIRDGLKPRQDMFTQTIVPVESGSLLISGSDGLFKCFSISAMQRYFHANRGNLGRAVEDLLELAQLRNDVELSDDMARVDMISLMNQKAASMNFSINDILFYDMPVTDDVTVAVKQF